MISVQNPGEEHRLRPDIGRSIRRKLSTKTRDGKLSRSSFRSSLKPAKKDDDDDNVSMFCLSLEAQKSVEESVNKIKAQHQHILDIPYEDYEYPFENIAFEGGGCKGLVYLGVLQVR